MASKEPDDREILRQFQQLMMPKEGFDEENFAYFYEHTGNHGMYVHQAKAAGWQLVHGADPENTMLRDQSGYCTIGDTILMRMPKARKAMIDRAQAALVKQQIGRDNEEERRAQINEKISKLVGHSVNMTFEFKDQRIIEDRKRGN